MWTGTDENKLAEEHLDVDVAGEAREEEKEALTLEKQMAASSSLEKGVDVAGEVRVRLPEEEEEEEEEALALQKDIAASLEEDDFEVADFEVCLFVFPYHNCYSRELMF